MWYHSMHERVKLPKQKCSCRYFMVYYKMSAKKKWDKSYIDFDIAIKKFQSLKLELMNIMVLNNEKLKQKLVEQFLRHQKNNCKNFCCIYICRNGMSPLPS